MKYTQATLVLLVLGVMVVGAGELHKRSTARDRLALRSMLATLNVQQLARRAEPCQPSNPHIPWTAWEAAKILPDPVYCAEVMRAVNAQPMQVVEIPQIPFDSFRVIPAPAPAPLDKANIKIDVGDRNFDKVVPVHNDEVMDVPSALRRAS